MSLSSAMRSYARTRPGMDESELAQGFLSSQTKQNLVALLADEFVHLQRAGVRNTEALILSRDSGTRRTLTVDAIHSELGGLSVLLDEPYRIGDGKERPAGDLTTEEWQIRRLMLQSQRLGIERAIEICDRAIDAIKQAGVRTLREIAETPELAVAA